MKSIRGTQYMCMVLGVCSSALPPSTVAQSQKNPRIVFQWNQLEFDYASEAERSADIAAGLFTPATIGPIDVDVYYSRRAPNLNHVFISIPRFVAGIPATFGIVTNRNYSGNPLIRPYPDWSWHKNPEQCKRNRIVSVFRVRIDECGRLWVLDTGKIGSNIICRPQILAFDVETNQVIHRHELGTEVVGAQYLLVTPAVDVRDPNSGCQDTFVYVADVLGYSLIVYDVFRDRSWRIQDKSMYPYPNFGTYNIAGDSFELMDGILGLSLSPNRQGEDRVLFFHAMSSPTENWVYTSDIRNYTRFQDNPASYPEIFHTYNNGRTTQSAAEDINKDGIMFFGLLGDVTIACWSTGTDYGTKQFDIVANNPVTMQFPSGIKVIRNSRGEEELWILTSRFQKIANGSLNTNEPNFRIQAVMIDELVRGSSCQGKHYSQNQIAGASSGYGLSGKRG
ncbi:major royal jelly protein 3-like isoform X2 [Sitophilus oryzae]|uniref:Major royal jelly protein 3-like isoform X2 n=1 Tax=Sitophilus oryzae TaxID=7048 RepID=A0A6J2XJH3_SITOR|nr:major royal jelly protein 3-like isoform X2 [Sitophilus oryzae]